MTGNGVNFELLLGTRDHFAYIVACINIRVVLATGLRSSTD